MSDFTATRALFDLPEGVIYLNGNSLGPLPRGCAERAQEVMQEEWGRLAPNHRLDGKAPNAGTFRNYP